LSDLEFLISIIGAILLITLPIIAIGYFCTLRRCDLLSENFPDQQFRTRFLTCQVLANDRWVNENNFQWTLPERK